MSRSAYTLSMRAAIGLMGCLALASCATAPAVGQYKPVLETNAQPSPATPLRIITRALPKDAVHIGDIEVRGPSELEPLVEEAKRLATQAGAQLLVIDRIDARPLYRKDAVLTENGDVKTTYKKGWQGRLQARAFRAGSPSR